ncbi:MAG: transposase [Proteobacteria bacterium]|nr:transposase [Pseudomonadota bacterium]
MAFENIALRQQLSVFHQKKKRPILSNFDRLFWIVLSKLSLAWKETLIIVEPETVIKWHRKGFKLFWRWKSRHRNPGRPKIDKELRRLIRQMAIENRTWGVPQIHNAFPHGKVPRFLLRDRDSIYGSEFRRRVKYVGTEEVITAYKSPWQNPYAERVIGSIRRDCLNHCVVLGERHLHRLVSEYVDYYNRSRTHLGLNKDCPITRDIDPPENGPIKSKPVLGGLHHRYYREAA